MARNLKKATKSDAEKEQEEAERLVRKSPKKKPPRKDKERSRVEVEDPDTDTEDKDLSMNYKDIGGSVVLAAMVAYRYMYAKTEKEQFLETEVQSPETGENVKVKTLKSKPEGSKGHDKYLELRKKFDEDSEEGETGPKKDKKDDDPWGDANWEQDSAEIKEEKKRKEDPWDDASWEEETARRKEEKKEQEMEKREKLPSLSDDTPISEVDTADLYDVAEFGTSGQSAQALEAIQERKKPIPSSLPEPQDFKGELSLEQTNQLKEQVKNWSVIDYSSNLKQISEDFAEAALSGNERDKEYFKQIMDVYEDSRGSLRGQTLGDLDDVSDMYGDQEGLDQAADEYSNRVIKKKKPQWWSSMMFAPMNDVAKAKESIEDRKKSVTEGTREEAYLNEMETLADEVIERKMFDSNTASGRLLQKIQEESETEGLKDIDPANFDLTDPDSATKLVDALRSVSDDTLVEIIRNEPQYRMHFPFGAQDENVSISDKDKQSFFNALEEDLLTRGFYEQVRFHNDADNQVFEKGDLLAFRDKIKDKAIKEEGKDVLKQQQGFWGTFLDWMNDMAETEFHKNSSRKRAQYRGLPGPLDDTDIYKPPSPDWRLPVSTADLDIDDYIAIVAQAREWLKDSVLAYEVVTEDFDMACRLALDYSIYTASNYQYNGAVGAPEYDRLLGILFRIEGAG